MPQEFTVTLTDDEADALRQLAAHWRENLDEALRRVVSTGIDISMMGKENDEDQARQYRPGGDLDDGIPF